MNKAELARHCPASSGVVTSLPNMSAASVAMVRRFEAEALKLPQVAIATEHTLHAGMYARTIMIPAGVVLTGAEIKIPTLLVINGDVLIYGDDGPVHFSGHHVLLGQAGRKQAFFALHDTHLTMLFPSTADTVDEAEREFTDEYEMLLSRKGA